MTSNTAETFILEYVKNSTDVERSGLCRYLREALGITLPITELNQAFSGCALPMARFNSTDNTVLLCPSLRDDIATWLHLRCLGVQPERSLNSPETFHLARLRVLLENGGLPRTLFDPLARGYLPY